MGRLSAAAESFRGVDAADRLCEVCVDLLAVDEVAVSVIVGGANAGTFGASSATARVFDELQFTLGEGPCLDAVAIRASVLIDDLAEPANARWPAYGRALLSHQIRGVFAIPVVLAGEYLGALDLFRARAGPLDPEELTGAAAAAELAGIALLDLLAGDHGANAVDPTSDMWAEMTTFARVEVSQATGVLVAQLDVGPAEALVRLRAHAYAVNGSATDVAKDILDGRLKLKADP